jgi:purine-nucleoside phosphorylase
MNLLDDLTASVKQVSRWLNGRTPQLAIVLGSGLAAILDHLDEPVSLTYADLPDFAASGVVGHAGCLHFGCLFGKPVLVFQGRYHCYEGYSAWQVTAPVRLAAALGCQKILLTNAAGGIADVLKPGDFMLVTDHLNMNGENPLRGRPELEFIDLCGLYRQDFYPQLKQQLAEHEINLHAGVLAWMLGPSYETPAEIKLLQAFGADAVSMSTIPEAIIARRFGLEVVAVSYISNLAAGKSEASLNHQDVLASGKRAANSLESLFVAILSHWLD